MNINLEGLPAMLEKVTFASLLPALLYLMGGLLIVKIVMGALTKALERSGIELSLIHI